MLNLFKEQEKKKEFAAEKTMKKAKKNQKVCSRGHKYKGNGPCPVCWPGYKKQKATKKK